ncbi:Phospholipase D zeta 1 [Linum perenne]
MAFEDVKTSDEAAVSTIVNLAEEAKLARECVKTQGPAFISICKSLVAGGVAGGVPPEGWCHPHRFGSFAPPRRLSDDGSQAQWFIDGRAAFEAIASAIEDAKSEIFICGWWLCPELYLRRPFQNHASSRLDALLEAKAKQGVQIYIFSTRRLLLLSKSTVFIARKNFLAFMRMESESNSWEDKMKDELDRTKYPLMPWHDVHCALWGPPCRDIARHFVQRWNHAKMNKAPYEEAIPLLMPQQHMVMPHYMGNSSPVEIKSKNADGSVRIPMQDSSSRSSFQDIPLLLPQEPEELDGLVVAQSLMELKVQLISMGKYLPIGHNRVLDLLIWSSGKLKREVIRLVLVMKQEKSGHGLLASVRWVFLT